MSCRRFISSYLLSTIRPRFTWERRKKSTGLEISGSSANEKRAAGLPSLGAGHSGPAEVVFRDNVTDITKHDSSMDAWSVRLHHAAKYMLTPAKDDGCEKKGCRVGFEP